MIISERKFVINIPQERVEQLIMKAMVNALQPERLCASNDKCFRAMVRASIGPIKVPIDMEGEIMSLSNPLIFMMRLRGLWGIFCLNQRATFMLVAIDKDKTQIETKVIAEDMALLVKIFMLWKVKRFAVDVLDRFENQLREYA